jgi:hypothetical protein
METFERTTNALQFVIEPLNPPDEMVLATIPVVDGRSLTELIEEFEKYERLRPRRWVWRSGV